MPKFRASNKNSKSSNKTVNRAGGEAFEQSPKMSLVSLLLTSFVKDKFYESADSQLERLDDLTEEISDKKFVAKSAIYARNEFGMRSITHALLAELPNKVKGKEWTKRAIEKGIYRTDDMMEILSYHLNKYGKPIPNALKKGLANAVHKFDEYQLKKYQNKGSSLSLQDLFNLVHPNPRDREELFEKIMSGEATQERTFQKEMTQAGQEAETEEELEQSKAEKWNELVKNEDLGYFATLRNLRNILEYADQEAIDKALGFVTNEKAIENTKVLPFNYQKAVKALEKTNFTRTNDALDALYDAIDTAVGNVPELPGETLIVLDESGSMTGGTWGNSIDSDAPIFIGSLFAASLYKANNSDLITFAGDAEYKNLSRRSQVMDITRRLIKDAGGGSTNFKSVLYEANKEYDRMIFLTDMQGWVGYNAPTKELEQYKDEYDCNPKIFSFDLQGYGDIQFPEDQVYEVSGFSDKVFDLIDALETDKDALIKDIEEIEI